MPNLKSLLRPEVVISQPNELKVTIRYLIPAAILLGGAGLFFSGNPTSDEDQATMRDQRAAESFGRPTHSSEPRLTKSKIRNHHPKPTLGETTELLESTIFHSVDLPEQSLSERVLAINQLIEQTGVPPTRLRIYCDTFNPVGKVRIGKLKEKNISAASLLRLTTDSGDLRSIVRNGKVEITIPESDGID